MKRLLIIAGSDSGGGAGIQADIKTATVYGVYAMTAVTAITVQDTRGVHGVHTIPNDVIAEQIRVCLTDIGADAIKTGMLHDVGVITSVASVLARHAPNVPLVVDPVMVAKGGTPLVNDTAMDAMKHLLMPRATLVTPNVPEAEALIGGGTAIATEADLFAGGRRLRELGAQAVLMKGGHLSSEQVSDVLVTAAGEDLLSAPRFKTPHTHGTGCTLASAIGSGLALGWPLRDAVLAAKEYVLAAIKNAPGLGHGHGPLNHMHGIRQAWN